MKNIKTIFTIVLFAICAINFGYSQGFVQVKGKAIDVSISPKSGEVYVIGISKNIFKYDANVNRFNSFSNKSNDNIRIAAVDDKEVFTIKTNGALNQSSSSTGHIISGVSCKDVAVDARGNAWVTEKRSGNIKTRHRFSFTNPFSAINNVDKVAPTNHGKAWAVMKNKSIKYFNGTSWQNMPGIALDIAVDLSNNDAYVVGISGSIFKWSRSKKNWLALKGTRRDFVTVDAEKGKIWGTTKNKGIYYYKDKDYSVYRVTFTRFIDEKPIEIFGTMGIYVNGKSGSTPISIRPKNNKRNRVFDVSKGSPVKLKDKRSRVKRSQFINKKYARGSDLGFDNTLYIRKYRDFDVDDNIKEIEFDLQFNLKQKIFLNGEEGVWERKKLKIKDVVFGNEYLFQHKSSGIVVGFKIEKL